MKLRKKHLIAIAVPVLLITIVAVEWINASGQSFSLMELGTQFDMANPSDYPDTVLPFMDLDVSSEKKISVPEEHRRRVIKWLTHAYRPDAIYSEESDAWIGLVQGITLPPRFVGPQRQELANMRRSFDVIGIQYERERYHIRTLTWDSGTAILIEDKDRTPVSDRMVCEDYMRDMLRKILKEPGLILDRTLYTEEAPSGWAFRTRTEQVESLSDDEWWWYRKAYGWTNTRITFFTTPHLMGGPSYAGGRADWLKSPASPWTRTPVSPKPVAPPPPLNDGKSYHEIMAEMSENAIQKVEDKQEVASWPEIRQALKEAQIAKRTDKREALYEQALTHIQDKETRAKVYGHIARSLEGEDRVRSMDAYLKIIDLGLKDYETLCALKRMGELSAINYLPGEENMEAGVAHFYQLVNTFGPTSYEALCAHMSLGLLVRRRPNRTLEDLKEAKRLFDEVAKADLRLMEYYLPDSEPESSREWRKERHRDIDIPRIQQKAAEFSAKTATMIEQFQGQ